MYFSQQNIQFYISTVRQVAKRTEKLKNVLGVKPCDGMTTHTRGVVYPHLKPVLLTRDTEVQAFNLERHFFVSNETYVMCYFLKYICEINLSRNSTFMIIFMLFHATNNPSDGLTVQTFHFIILNKKITVWYAPVKAKCLFRF